MALFRKNFLYAGVACSYWSSPCPISLYFFVHLFVCLFVFFCRIALPTIVTDRSKTCRQMWSSCLRTQERTTLKLLWSVCVCVCVCVRERRKIELTAWVKKCPFPSTGFEPVPLGYAPIVLPITPQGRHASRQSKQTLQTLTRQLHRETQSCKETLQLLSAGPLLQASARTSAESDEACQRKTQDRADGMRGKGAHSLDRIRTCICGIRAHGASDYTTRAGTPRVSWKQTLQTLAHQLHHETQSCKCVCVCVLCVRARARARQREREREREPAFFLLTLCGIRQTYMFLCMLYLCEVSLRSFPAVFFFSSCGCV